MMKNNKLYSAIYIASLCLASASVHADGNFYVLGDSMTDNGNLARDFPTEMSEVIAAQAAQGYVGGRSVNGPTWGEYLPLLTGLNSDTEDNYAYAGATTSVGGMAELFIPLGGASTGFLTQLSQFQDNVAKLDSNDVVAIWIGSNDTHLAASSGIDASITSATALSNVTTGINAIRAMGGRNFVIMGPYDMALINPAAFGHTNYDNALATTTSLQINQGYQALDIDGVNFHYLDMFTLFQRVQANPSAYGFISADSTNSCIDNACQTLTLEQQNKYLFMDYAHLTTGFHETIGQYAANLISAGNVTALQGDSTVAVMDLFQQNTLSQLRSGANWITQENYQWYLTPHLARTEQKSKGIGGSTSESDLIGISAGLQFSASENTQGGVAINYSRADTDLSGDYGSNDIDALQLAGFFRFNKDEWFFDGGVSASRGGLDLVRTGVFEDMKANPNTHALGAFAQAGSLFDLGETGFKVGPVASLRYTDSKVNSYSETGDSLLTISVDDQEIQQLSASVGLKLQSPQSESGKMSYQLQLSTEH